MSTQVRLRKRERDTMVRMAQTGALSDSAQKLAFPHKWRWDVSAEEAAEWVDSNGPENWVWRQALAAARWLLYGINEPPK